MKWFPTTDLRFVERGIEGRKILQQKWVAYDGGTTTFLEEWRDVKVEKE